MNETKRWVQITAVENIPLREGRATQIGGHTFAIFNLGDRFLAVENRCPHRGGPLADGIVSGTTVVCPLHAWKVDLATGTVTNQPDHLHCVKTFRTRVQDGVIAVELTLSDSSAISSPSDCFGSISDKSFASRTSQSEV